MTVKMIKTVEIIVSLSIIGDSIQVIRKQCLILADYHGKFQCLQNRMANLFNVPWL